MNFSFFFFKELILFAKDLTYYCLFIMQNGREINSYMDGWSCGLVEYNLNIR